ncbi:PREDICTED: uncharacterized protein LOC109359838 [Lupinus angustifolius]|uniref:uncharacterized protein LOC109359838 n=1 Tax=Lupinus angustifolius TaxID=3871 RepID=UPI00092F0735|nr:PREDICTED: uncharacterized protein LOC109359838 [Lupinus angustifolius]
MTTIRAILSIAVVNNWYLNQLDVITTFLLGDLKENVYMKVPPGLIVPHSNLVCKLEKSLYGLKQAGSGMPSLLMFSYNQKLLNVEFSIKDLSELKIFLGMEIARSDKGILLYQIKYTLDLLEETCMLAYKPYSTPMEYAGRPDISFVVGHLSQFVPCPTNMHLDGAKRILRYLKGSISLEVFFSSAESKLKIKVYTDSDWGGCPYTRRSVLGYCFYLGNALISWKIKKQQVVSRSSAEVEYRAMTLATCEAQWLIYLLQDLHISHSQPVMLYCDNQSALHIAANPVLHERTNHIEIDCHCVREKVQSGLLHLLSIPTSSQLADIFIKSLSPGLYNSPFQA